MRVVWRVALLASLALLFFGVWFQVSLSRHWTRVTLPDGVNNPVLAMQLAKFPWPAAMLAPRENMAEMSRQQYIDFGYIPSYTALFVCIAILQGDSRRKWIAGLAPLCILLILIAAAFDIAENLAILGVTEQHQAASWMAIRPRALIKWGCAFLVVLLEAPFYLTVRLPALPRVLGLLLGVGSLVAGAVGFYSACAGIDRGVGMATLPLLVSMLVMPLFLWLGGRAIKSGAPHHVGTPHAS